MEAQCCSVYLSLIINGAKTSAGTNHLARAAKATRKLFRNNFLLQLQKADMLNLPDDVTLSERFVP